MKIEFKMSGSFEYDTNYLLSSRWFRITINGRAILNQLSKDFYIYFVRRMNK